MPETVLRSRKRLTYAGKARPLRVDRAAHERMMARREQQEDVCAAVGVSETQWSCAGGCPYDEGAGMFPACMPFYFGEPGDPEYVYWCQCTTEAEWNALAAQALPDD